MTDNNHNEITQLNLQHWDQIASSYGKTFAQAIAQMAQFVQQNMAFIGLLTINGITDNSSPSIRVLDYACGPGTMTSVFLDYATEFVGFDISKNMIERYNENFKDHKNIKGYVANLLTSEAPSLPSGDGIFDNFDLVVVSGGYHHFPDIPLATQRLTERLRKGGKLLILDFVQHVDDVGDHPAAKTITRHGFSSQEMRQFFADAGLVDIEIVESDKELGFNGITRTPFLARGTRQ